MPSTTDHDTLGPGLYLVATPIGNLDDITLRALAVLRGVDLILAEDTRRTRKLLTHHDARTPMISLHEHNEAAQVVGLVERLAAGERMALVSDAGTPLISDPGHRLVRGAIDAGVSVVPIPGASAVLAALTASGMPTDRFTFCGYPPRKAAARARFFEGLAGAPGTVVFLESPRRLAATLAAAGGAFGERPVAVARELTKVHEEFVRGTLPEVAARYEGTEVRGEVTVCVAGADAVQTDPAGAPGPLDRRALETRFARLLEKGTPRNEALKELAREHGVARREVYRALMVEVEEEEAP